MQNIVHALVNTGYAYVTPSASNVPVYLVEAASEAMQWLIKYYEELGINPITRVGENEPDILLIQRKVEEQKDVKSFFHFSHDAPWPADVMALSRFRTLSLLHDSINALIARVLDAMQKEYPRLFMQDVLPLFRQSTMQSLPYSTTTLRGLAYPPGRSARMHFDRGFITAHCGDKGGFLVQQRPGGQPEAVSPPPGHLLLFWGVKAAWVSKGLLKPMFHGSESSDNMMRSAMVQFCHIDIGQPVADAALSYLECRKFFNAA